jgi:ethanolamine utilization protein EutQ (cupin superfamily)
MSAMLMLYVDTNCPCFNSIHAHSVTKGWQCKDNTVEVIFDPGSDAKVSTTNLTVMRTTSDMTRKNSQLHPVKVKAWSEDKA